MSKPFELCRYCGLPIFLVNSKVLIVTTDKGTYRYHDLCVAKMKTERNNNSAHGYSEGSDLHQHPALSSEAKEVPND